MEVLDNMALQNTNEKKYTENDQDVYDAILRVKHLKRKARNEKEHMIIYCTELAIITKEKKELENEVKKLMETITKLREENQKLLQSQKCINNIPQDFQRSKIHNIDITPTIIETDSKTIQVDIKPLRRPMEIKKINGIAIQPNILQNTGRKRFADSSTQTKLKMSRSIACLTEKLTSLSVHCDTSDLQENMAKSRKKKKKLIEFRYLPEKVSPTQYLMKYQNQQCPGNLRQTDSSNLEKNGIHLPYLKQSEKLPEIHENFKSNLRKEYSNLDIFVNK
ncbi:uncharacterized protein LOC130613374 isoform X1 [Hydractinia symbiolongicarpus]|uniref:uncharacterized protein LOC130613374 isoform X1 n=1 Tax=Hydractinia symbiolongicarpus TaxID=13093 RepID=UPI00254A97DB|nr:uncharacterized protein LOC130613374 isoform X1 [Hydractinia symbiolongicarpus]XP_057290712.1 uncharacterized protein LOC130613374 isoform X1 [Hydractinia symbiolongicarpus]